MSAAAGVAASAKKSGIDVGIQCSVIDVGTMANDWLMLFTDNSDFSVPFVKDIGTSVQQEDFDTSQLEEESFFGAAGVKLLQCGQDLVSISTCFELLIKKTSAQWCIYTVAPVEVSV